jgi:hypothetical protein
VCIASTAAAVAVWTRLRRLGYLPPVSILPQHLIGVLDRTAVREAMLRYATAIDRRDDALLAACFAEDVHCVLEGIDLRGVDDVVSFISTNLARPPIVGFAHMLNNIAVDIDGDRAHAETDALSYLITDAGEGARLRLRGLRYVDELVRGDDGWLIRDHVHRPVWEHTFPVRRF